MADTGWRDLTTFTSVADAGVNWTNPTYAAASDDSRAYAEISPGRSYYTDPLRGVNLAGTDVPAGATIDGIEVRVERSSIFGIEVQTFSIRLVVAEVASGIDYASNDWWPTIANEAYITYGSPTDKWLLPDLSAADVNGATFGVQVQAAVEDSDGTAYVDHMQMKIYYTEAVGGAVPALMFAGD